MNLPGIGLARSVVGGLVRGVLGAPDGDREPRPVGPALTYVDYGALMTPPAPFRSLDTTLYGFWARVDEAKVSALCKKVFDQPSHGAVRCRPLGAHAMITWGFIGSVVSQTPDYDKRGAVTEPQVAVWVPVGLREPGSRDERFAMFIPYIWLDNPMSLATGRELFGYPKSWGWPERPTPDGPQVWKLDVFGLNYGGDAHAARHPLLEVRQRGALEDAVESDLSSLWEVARDAAGRLFESDRVLLDLELGPSFVDDLLHERMPGVFLKQFRDVRDGLGASLQQVVQADYEIVRLRAKPLLLEHELTVHKLDSHPVGEELGLADQTLGLAYEVVMDFNVGAGRVLWDAAGR
jgi:hypothetical protein